MLSRFFAISALAMSAGSFPALAQKADATTVTLDERVERLQARIERAESIRAIKRLQYAYGHYVELGLWNDFADLFTEDAITNYQQGARGKAQIRKLFFEQVGQGKLGLAEGRIYPHILFQPVITLGPDGRTAKGRWRILAMLGGYGGGATWYSGVYENEYVFDPSEGPGGAWKISVLRSEPRVTAAYTAAGWKDSGVHVPFHYTVMSVTRPISDSANRNAKTASGTTLAIRVNELAQRAGRLNDQAQVTNLQDTYGYAMDRRLWDQASDLFAVDGTLELGLQGVYVGKASIRRALGQFGPPGRVGYLGEELNDHVYLQTLVSVAPDGRTAKARGVELIFSRASGGELSEGTFENSFVKQGTAWKIQSVHFYPRMIVDAVKGWAKSARPAPGPNRAFPPDRPPTASYEIYPKFAVAPFHFDNPVTGKPPQYPEGTPALRLTAPIAIASAPVTRKAADLQARMDELERSINSAEAYDAAENLIGAYGYYMDKSSAAGEAGAGEAGGLFASNARNPESGPPQAIRAQQLLQPVIQVSRDGKTAKIRARSLELRGDSSGAGFWAAGVFDGEAVQHDGAWKFRTLDLVPTWGAAYPGGWAPQTSGGAAGTR